MNMDLIASQSHWGYVSALPCPHTTPGVPAEYGRADQDGRYYVYQSIGISDLGNPLKEYGVDLGAGFYGPHLFVLARQEGEPVGWEALEEALKSRDFPLRSFTEDMRVWLYRGFAAGKTTWDQALLFLPDVAIPWRMFENWARKVDEYAYTPSGMAGPYAELKI